MVINPHLLSLADGPHRVHDQLHQMNCAPQNYVRFVKKLQQHYVTLSDERILLSFGRLPCICAAQGTREKKLDVGADIRRIEDAAVPAPPRSASPTMATSCEATPSSRRLRECGKSPS